VERAEYEHPGVLERKTRQVEIRRRADEDIARLDGEMAAERAALSYMHGILTLSGPELVAVAKTALEAVGFKKVVDADQAEPDPSGNLQEDLQIHDRPPILVLEVKGLASLPAEQDTLQVTKYVQRRMRRWNRTDVQGLVIVNHQRHTPALDRDHAKAFTHQQEEDAENFCVGLMTTWDLYRLLRGKARWGWPDEVLLDLFYGTGRISLIPTHYVPVGKVERYIHAKNIIGIAVAGGPSLKTGDKIGYLLPGGFYEEDVTSLEVDRDKVTEAVLGQTAGHLTTLNKEQVTLGMQVYRVDFP
jgi:hypothetical protein